MLKRSFFASRRRSGFTLAEVLIAFALIAVLASVTVPAVKSRIQDGYEDALIQEFQSLASAIVAFRQDVGHYPGKIDYLISMTSGATDVCAVAISSTDSAKWNGPYIMRSYQSGSSSYPVANRDAVITSLILSRLNTSVVSVRIDNLDNTTAADIDLKVDGTSNANAGTIRITSGTPNQVYWVIPTKTGAC